MSKKSQTIITFVFLMFVFIIFWVFFIADFINMAGSMYVNNPVNEATGLETFFYSNLNLFIMIGLILSIFIAGVVGTR